MVYEYAKANERILADNFKIKDLFPAKHTQMNLVIGELNGFHGTFVNSRSIKYYFIIEGSAVVSIDENKYNVHKNDFVVIPVNSKHSIEGNVKFAIMCTPSFNAKDEDIVSPM